MAEHGDAQAQEDCYHRVACDQKDHGEAFWNSGLNVASNAADCFGKWNPHSDAAS
jgi:hypothetical protein